MSIITQEVAATGKSVMTSDAFTKPALEKHDGPSR